MSLIVGISGEGQLWDEQPECIGYAHHSEPMEQLIARLGRSTSRKNGLPLVDQITSVRLVRLAGMLSNGDYSTFKGTPWVEAASPDMIVDKVNNIDLPDEARHIVAILPATNANAIYAFGPDLHVKRPLSVWALFREADGNGIEGWDAEHFLCNEWTNHLGYDTEPPRPEEFQWGD